MVQLMNAIRILGRIDEQHRLSVEVPHSIPPGSVTVFIVPISTDDDGEDAWMTSLAAEWEDELSDTRQDIYTMADGEPVIEP